ncbi:putative No apical meristem-associated domain-containing protein [Helianthus annuus]|uniref:No apical meristem-associated domain-containing protein n=1 Tax=Helianthus annuus TaxID=4232 RepID=A0A9K3E408_HELAN|nr:putative No apical meristem-associated domain-containing protein [Helianthus annuus]
MSSKWRKMNGFVNRFCEEYNKIYSSGLLSGMSDEYVFKKALEMYKANTGTTFAHVRAREIMRTHQKWAPIPNDVEMAKQQRTSESGSYSAGGSNARCHINLNDDAEFDEEEYAVHEAERPPGRDKSKKERAKEKEKQKVDPKMDEFMTQFKTYTEVTAQKAKAKAKERAIEEKSRLAREKLRVAGEKNRLSDQKIRLSDEKIQLKEWEILTMDVDNYPERNVRL